MKIVGYFVRENCEDYDQVLTLRFGPVIPPEGILDWRDKEPATLFPTRKAARQAITRTEHFRLAWGRTDLPERKLCSVLPAYLAATT